jgi:hypothetical protein
MRSTLAPTQIFSVVKMYISLNFLTFETVFILHFQQESSLKKIKGQT